MSDEPIGCARPTGTVVGVINNDTGTSEKQLSIQKREENMVAVKVGGKAPDFEAPAYHRGKFTTVKLSDYLGKWVLICFYPGDFTFV